MLASETETTAFISQVVAMTPMLLGLNLVSFVTFIWTRKSLCSMASSDSVDFYETD